MNHCVPDFEMDDEFPIPTSSSSTITTQKAEDDIMELIWQEGRVVVHSQTQRSLHKSPQSETPAEPPPPQPPPLPPPPQNTQLYMAEDEMATWLHYPFEDLYADLLYPTSTPQPPITLAQLTAASARAPEVRQSPPKPPPSLRPPVTTQSAARNFQILSTLRGRATEASSSRTGLTLVDSYDTPSPVRESGPPNVAVSRGDPSGDGGGASLSRGGGSGDMTATSSPRASGSGYAAAETATGTAVDDRKRKGRETDDATATTTECQTEDVELESADEKKQYSRGSTATKRSRAAEVHNLSERRRRDRINEKMKALQELIPRCNKSDKASMLDEAIEYLKSLQMQVQMMSMGCGMVPMMYPGIQQPYMPPMGMGMGMGMGMDIGMTRAMMPFPSAVGGSALPTSPAGPVIPTSQAAAAAPQLGQRLPAPAFPMLPFQAPGPSVLQPINQEDPIRSSFPMQSSGLPQFPNAGDPYQHYLALQQMQMQALQNQSLSQPGSSKPSTSKSEDDYDHNQCG